MSRRLARLVPGLQALITYDRRDLRFDLGAGLSVAAVALPVGIAYAEIAGVPPLAGVYAAIFPLFAYALFGSSRQLMVGPDAATCIMAAAGVGILAGGDPDRYLALMVLLTLLTAVLYIVAGAARLGFVADFLSQPILIGYLNGVALLILVGQLPKLLGFGIDAHGFGPQLAAIAAGLDQTHLPSLGLGLGLLALLLATRRYFPRLPAALVVIVAGIALVVAFDLDGEDIKVLGALPTAAPALGLPSIEFGEFRELLGNAAGIMLISFTSGVLTAKSFARRNRQTVNANRELYGFGAANFASGLAGGFPVTGADSRTAVNYASGGRTQLVGVIAGAVMLGCLAFLTIPLAYVPQVALAAVIVVAATGLFDLSAAGTLWRSSRREFGLSLATTIGVLVLGVLPGVLFAVVLSLIWLLSVESRPTVAILGRVKGVKGFHDIRDYPEARTIPGLLIVRFNGNVLFFNSDYFRDRVLNAVTAAGERVRWVVIDASPVNLVDYTGLQSLDVLREELESRGIRLVVARAKRNLRRFFEPGFVQERRDIEMYTLFPTLGTAVAAFEAAALDEPTEQAREP